MRHRLLFLALLLNSHIIGQKIYPKIATGILFSDVHSEAGDGWYNYGNSWKRGWWVSVGVGFKVWEIVHLESNVTYQERKALEVFEFPMGDSAEQTKSAQFARFVFRNYPTSPQSEGFDNPMYDFKHFPNFKYLSLEAIPTFKFFKKLSLNIGIGLFVGILLNKDQTTVSQDDLPFEKVFFEPPFNAFGEVRYYRYDFGWIPKIDFSYALGKRILVGLTAKSNLSFLRMNDTFVYPYSSNDSNVHWKAYLIGLDFQYRWSK